MLSRRSHAIAAAIAFTCVVSACWLAEFSTAYFANPDAYDYAQMGRELRSGHGFATRQLFPRHLPTLTELGLLQAHHAPNLYRYPAPVMANAMAQLLVSDPLVAAVAQSGLWFILSVPLLFMLAWRLGGTTAAVLAMAIVLSDLSAWVRAYAGMSEPLGAFLTLSIALLVSSPSLRTVHFIAIGALCGAAILARTQLWALLPPVAWLIWRATPKERHGAALGTALLSMAVILAPWWIRNYLVVGEPLFSFSTTRVLLIGAVPEMGDAEKVLHAPVGTTDVLQVYGPAIASKFLGQLLPKLPLPIWWVGKPFYGALLCVAAGVAAYLNRRRRLPALLSRYTVFVISYAFTNLLVVSVLFDASRFFVTVQPLVAAAFAAMLSAFLHDRFSSHPRLAMTWTGVVAILCACLSLLSSTRDIHRPKPPEPALYRAFGRSLDPDALVASDVSYLFSLYSDTLSLRLPLRPAELLEIHREYLPVDFVVLSREGLDPSKRRGLFGSYAAYAKFIDTPDFRGAFAAADPLPNGSLVFRRRR